MTRIRFRAQRACMLPVAVLAAALTWPAGGALAQNSGGFLDNLFNPHRQDARQPEPQQPEAQQPAAQPAPQVTQAGSVTGDNELASRVDRVENTLRQLTGTIEQLQHQTQLLQMQLKRMQDDTEYRFQQLSSRGGGTAPAAAAPPVAPPTGAAPPQAAQGKRSDVFDPSQHPNAPGAPHTLGNASAPARPQAAGQQIGAPGGRTAGAPLDLSTLAGNAPAAPPQPAPENAPVTAPPVQQPAPQASQSPPPRTTQSAGVQLATLPPSASPKDEYQLAYGYVLHKDYALAEQAFGDFVRKYPNERLLPDAQYWLGESQFQQQRYRDAAESFLAVSTKYERSSMAPEALLRLGQSLAALKQKEAACATFAEIGRKYPRASSKIKNGVARELKRAHC
jgi:tol-pal system protein YbgF